MAKASLPDFLSRYFLSAYQTSPYSRSSRARIFVVLLLLLWPTFLVVVLSSNLMEGGSNNVLLALGFSSLAVVLLAFVRSGRLETAVPVFTLGLGFLLLSGHFSGDYAWYNATNPLLITRLFYLGLTNIVFTALLTERRGILLMTAGLYLGAGAYQVIVLQAPLMTLSTSNLLTLSAIRSGGVFVFAVAFVLLLQRLSHQAVASAEQASQSLEEEVARRTVDLTSVLERLQLAQKSLVEGEKLAALGRLSANVAHEVNTPMGAIHSSAGTVADFLSRLPAQFLETARQLSPSGAEQFLALLGRCDLGYNQKGRKELKKIARELQDKLKDRKVDQPAEVAETLAELGLTDLDPEWVALLRHPHLPSVLHLAQVLVGLQCSTSIIDEAATKATDFIKALRRFMYQEEPSQDMEPIDLATSLETVLTLLKPELNPRITLVRHFRDRPQIWGHPNQLHQVWSNLVHNAIQAMKEGGTLKVSIKEKEHKVLVEIEDTGEGIPTGLKEKIFEPFFTTKKMGEGTGLGLKIVQDFVVQHHGTLDFESEPGKTVFRVTLRKGHPKEELEFR